MADRSIADLVKLIAKTAHIVLMDGAQDPHVQHRRLPRHRQPGRPRALPQRSGGLRGAAHLRRHGRADDGGARPRPRRDVRRVRSAVGDAPDRALHRPPARRRHPARARLRRRLSARRRVPAGGRRAPAARARLRPLPDLRRARPRPGAGGPRPPAAGADPAPGDDQRAARPGGRRADPSLPAARPRRAARARDRRGRERVARPAALPLGLRRPRDLRVRLRALRHPHDRADRPHRSRAARAGDPRGGLEHLPAALGRRRDRPAHRLRHDRDEHRPVGRLRRRLPTPATSEAYHRFVAAMREIYGYELRPADPPGARRRAHPERGADQSPASSSPATCTSPRPRSTRSSPAACFVDVIVDAGARPAERVPVEGQHRPRQARRPRRGARRRRRSPTSRSSSP